MKPIGPGSDFELLLDLADYEGLGLPAEFKEVFGGDWHIPELAERPYSFSNFVSSHDGKVSFAVPGHEGGGDISGFNPHDQWFMGLARARADAVVVGANTLRTEHEHEWTAEFIFPSDRGAFDALRKSEGRKDRPLQVVVTNSGVLREDANIFKKSEFDVLVATSDEGLSKAKSYSLTNAEIMTFGPEVNLAELYKTLRRDFGCNSVLCEGGPRLYAAVVLAGQLDEEFLTLSPRLVGADRVNVRPGLIDGVALAPDNSMHAKLQSVRRAGDYLFLRTRFS